MAPSISATALDPGYRDHPGAFPIVMPRPTLRRVPCNWSGWEAGLEGRLPRCQVASITGCQPCSGQPLSGPHLLGAALTSAAPPGAHSSIQIQPGPHGPAEPHALWEPFNCSAVPALPSLSCCISCRPLAPVAFPPWRGRELGSERHRHALLPLVLSHLRKMQNKLRDQSGSGAMLGFLPIPRQR